MQYDYSRPGFTVTPNISQDPITGEEVIKVLQADVKSGDGKEFINQQNTREQANAENWHWDEDGNAKFGLEATNAELEMLINDMGGREQYDTALFWAQNTLSDNDIAEFDAVMEEGDLTEIADMMGQLHNLYQNRSHDVAEWDDAERFVYEEVCSPEVFRDVKDYLVSQSDDATIAEFNEIMNSGDEDDISYAINVIVAEINGEEYYDEEDDDDEDEDEYYD